jgi:3-methyladenine DNA glycosylase AlkD
MTLTYDAAMAALEASGSEQTRRTYLRHGASEPLFGVKFGDLRPLARRIGTDQDLADQLWASGNADARLLACMVADPASVSEDGLDAWLEDIDSYFLVDTFVSSLASRVPGRRERAERWIGSPRDRTAQAGWDLMNLVALSDEKVPSGYFEALLDAPVSQQHHHGHRTAQR